MKIGIVTLHSSYSYGACLQAYATYRVLENMGHDVEFVNYTNDFEQCQNHIIYSNPLKGFKGNIIKTAENIFLKQFFNRKKAFDKFHSELKKTKKYRRIDEMEDLHYDVLISGSDQLWNPDIFNGLDEVFFLNFGYAGKRMSYAASAGSHVFTSNESNKVLSLLSKYTYISAREDKLKDYIHSLTGRTDIKKVIDPTLLLSNEEWNNWASVKQCKLPPHGYILLFMIGVPYSEYKKRYKPIVEYYKKKLGLPVYAITPSSFLSFSGADKNFNTLSPAEFVYAIKEASLVITSSFHGVAFSVLFNKLFVALNTSNPDRINSLLSSLGISDRVLSEFDMNQCEGLLTQINYQSVNQLLFDLRTDSYQWLKSCLCNDL